MREFFHGWRRKAGCVTLVMACVIMGVWVRGQLAWESMEWRITSSKVITMVLARPYFHCKYTWATERVEDRGDKRSFQWRIEGDSTQYSFADAIFPCCGETYWSEEIGVFIDIPYIPTVLIFAAASAYLILWKPRMRVVKPEATPQNAN